MREILFEMVIDEQNQECQYVTVIFFLRADCHLQFIARASLLTCETIKMIKECLYVNKTR